MDRRDFLRKSFLAGAAGLAAATVPSCAYLPLLNPANWPILLPDMDRYLALFDAGLLQISKGGIIVGFTGESPQPQDKELLATRSLETLFVTGMFGDLSDEGQLHPGMQARVWKAMPGMNDAVFGTIGHLEAMTGEEKSDLRSILLHKSDPGGRFAAALDEQAAKNNVSEARRGQMKGMLRYILGRLKHQPADVLFDEIISKSKKLASRTGTVEQAEKMLAARMGSEAFHEKRQRYSEISEAWRQRCGTAGPTPGDSVLIAGGVIMGIGAMTLAFGGLALGTGGGIGAAVAMTVGGVLLLVGMITCIVGGVKRAKHLKAAAAAST